MKLIKKIMRPLHKWGALITGLILIIVCSTGAVLSFEQELIAFTTRGYYAQNAHNVSINVEKLYAAIQRQFPGEQIMSLTIPTDSRRNAVVVFSSQPGMQVYVNPNTAQKEGSFTYESSFFSTVRQLHRFLLMGPKGRIIVGTCSLVFALLLISGLLIRIPSSWNQVPAMIRITKGANSFRRIYDLHSAPGIFALLFLLAMSLTGPYWSFGWYNKMVGGLFGLNVSPGKSHRQASDNLSIQMKELTADDFKLIATNLQKLNQTDKPSAREYQLTFPTAREDKYVISSIPQKRIHSRQADTYTYSLNDGGALLSKSVFRDNNLKQTFRMWLFAVHTGSWGGLITKILYAVSVLVGASLPVTGYMMWWKKRRKSNKTKNASR